MNERLFSVGGVLMPRPFKVRRLGHFGINVPDVEAALDFYCRLLGYKISDPIDFSSRLPPEERGRHGSTIGYFLRHGTEHHSFVIFPSRFLHASNPHYAHHPELTTNQFTWQVGSLKEVVDGLQWFQDQGKKIVRSGRDVPGSNWHFYAPDPDGHVNELFYGIEQIGWSGHAKPLQVHQLRHEKPPQLPFRSEQSEVDAALAAALRLDAGQRGVDAAAEVHDVDGILLGRPFKVGRIGPIRIFVRDMERALRFYRDDLGMAVTEDIDYRGHRCVFLRANTEHHSLALYPLALRQELGFKADSTLMSFGMQLGSYAQLRDAAAFLRGQGVEVFTLPPALFPGMDYCAFARDPAGHAIQLYYRMDQIGWDGRPRPRAAAEAIPDIGDWPETVPAASDVYQGEIFLGPMN